MALQTLKRRSEFLRVRGGRRWACAAFVMEAKPRPVQVEPSSVQEAYPPRFGFTVTRKLGSAVVRNRIRRRLREALRTLKPEYLGANMDYVVVARSQAADLPYSDLQALLAKALRNVQKDRAKPSRPAAN